MAESVAPAAPWYVYIIECSNGSLYTGITTDVQRRYTQHESGTGARYTRAWPPRRLLACFAHADRASASRAEYAIKQLDAPAKRRLCADPANIGVTQPAGT